MPFILQTPEQSEREHQAAVAKQAEQTRKAVEDVKQRALDSTTMERGRVVGALFDALVNRDFDKPEQALLKKIQTALKAYDKAVTHE